MRNLNFKLPDGRHMEVDIYGPDSSEAIIFFHGLGSSSAIIRPDETWLEANRITFIAPNRPGIGNSDLQPNYSLFDVARDTNLLIQHLGYSRIFPLGWSAGAAYAIAYGLLFTEVITKIGLISPGLPFRGVYKKQLPNTWRMVGRINQYAPLFSKWFFRKFTAQVKEKPEKILDKAIKTMCLSDQILLEQMQWRCLFMEGLKEAYKGKGIGAFADAFAVCNTLYEPKDLKLPVLIWQGEHDKTWTPETAIFLKNCIPISYIKLIPRTGHLMLFSHWNEIMNGLLAY